jgi:hypothetical protein
MGDAEFQGGGSVKWKVRNSKGEHGNPGGAGKDHDPIGGGSFAVFKVENGKETLVFTHAVKQGNNIRVFWGPESDPTTVAKPVASEAKKKSTR